MNLKLKTIFAMILSALFTCSAFSATNKPFIVKKDGRKEYYDAIKGDRRGVLMVKKGKVTKKMNPGAYEYAWVPMPSEIKKATAAYKAKKYKETASLLDKCYSKYKIVGWGPYCLFLGGKALQAAGQNSAAIEMLNKMTEEPKNPNDLKYYLVAKKLLATLYFETSNYSKAETVLKALMSSKDSATAGFAYNLYGDMLLKQGKVKDAKLMYLTTALLFPSSNKKERPEALVKIIKLLRSEKNNKALEFEKKLKADYPGSKYVQEI